MIENNYSFDFDKFINLNKEKKELKKLIIYYTDQIQSLGTLFCNKSSNYEVIAYDNLREIHCTLKRFDNINGIDYGYDMSIIIKTEIMNSLSSILLKLNKRLSYVTDEIKKMLEQRNLNFYANLANTANKRPIEIASINVEKLYPKFIIMKNRLNYNSKIKFDIGQILKEKSKKCTNQEHIKKLLEDDKLSEAAQFIIDNKDKFLNDTKWLKNEYKEGE